MIWEDVVLLKETITDTDQLGNPIKELAPVKTCCGRITPWANENIRVDNRIVTRNFRNLVLQIPIEAYPNCGFVRYDGVVYEVDDVIDLYPRFTELRIKSYKE